MSKTTTFRDSNSNVAEITGAPIISFPTSLTIYHEILSLTHYQKIKL